MYFLQISDTHHRCSYEDVEDYFKIPFGHLHALEQKLKALAKEIKVPLSFLCHCGDLCHSGRVEDYRSLEKMMKRAFPKVPLCLAVGNHDEKDAMAEVFSDHDLSFHCRDFRALRVISFDNTNGTGGNGEITEETCEKILKALKEAPEKPSLLMSHHHVLPEQFAMPSAKLPDSFQELISQKNIVAYLTGHTHYAYQGLLGEIPYYTVGSMSFQGRIWEKSHLDLQEASYYHLFSYENGLLTLVKSGHLGFGRYLGAVQL